jgi:DNA end-binding protein Ku
MRGKEYLVALLAEKGILRAETLRFHDELRRPEDVGLKPAGRAPRAAVERYLRAVAELSEKDIAREELRDGYTERLRELIELKLERGVDVERAPVAEETGGEAEIIDLMEVLKRRLQPEARETAPAPARPASAAGRGAERQSSGNADLAERSKSELYERAKALQVPGRSKMDKDELVRALREAER